MGRIQGTGAAALAFLVAVAGRGAARAEAPTLDQLGELSVEQLSNIQVTSVAKRPEPISQAPASIYVITHDAIIRSGATSIPEMLRMAPNLQVAQTGAGSWVITARGLSGQPGDQNFPDKLLVLIDGRSVYTPLYSGVYWDVQDVPADDIDRIEVISGPGAALWGANAVNGVINIITRKAGETQGLLVDVGGGNLQQTASLQYGGRLGSDIDWRIYAKTFWDRDTVTAQNHNADDHWTKPQAGFRLDWAASSADSVTLSGDGYSGAHAEAGATDETVYGGNVLGSWRHAWQDGSTLQAQAYIDRSARDTLMDGHFWLNTYDVDVQHSFSALGFNQIVWGGGFRINDYRITDEANLLFIPPSRRMNLADLFVQDSLSVTKTLTLTLGLKLEDDPYVGLEPLPSIRLAWQASGQAMVWAAASRAIRAPTPFDRDVAEKFGGEIYLTGGSDFHPESLTAYELGTRLEPFGRVSLSVSAFYNVYGDLRSVEPAPGGFIPLSWGNGMGGRTYGFEAWSDYQILPWWRLEASFDLLHEDLSFKPGDLGLLGIAQAGDDPPRQAQIKSSMNLPARITWDADLRYVDALPQPYVPSYTELNTRIAWAATDHIQISLTGANLLHPYHQEFAGSAQIPRSVYAEVRWRF